MVPGQQIHGRSQLAHDLESRGFPVTYIHLTIIRFVSSLPTSYLENDVLFDLGLQVFHFTA